MIFCVYGGASSGKSGIAEEIAVKCGGRKVYAAAMENSGEESALKIRLHREQRKTKGFSTLEKSKGISLSDAEHFDTMLLECMGVWAANEMFAGGEIENIFRFIEDIKCSSKNFIIVSDNVFGMGTDYSPETLNYMKTLGEINKALGAASHVFLEAAAGIAFCLKGEDIYARYI